MVFDLNTLHTAISLVAIAAGAIVVLELERGAARTFWVTLFLVTAIATSASGFLFPFNGVLGSHVVGVIALLVLAVLLLARYAFGLAGRWRGVDAAGMVASLYLLVFVLVAQAFAKVPVLRNAAPTQSEPPLAIAQLVVLLIFVVIGVRAVRRA